MPRCRSVTPGTVSFRDPYPEANSTSLRVIFVFFFYSLALPRTQWHLSEVEAAFYLSKRRTYHIPVSGNFLFFLKLFYYRALKMRAIKIDKMSQMKNFWFWLKNWNRKWWDVKKIYSFPLPFLASQMPSYQRTQENIAYMSRTVSK